MVDKPNKFQAALLAGIIFGVLSSIPVVQLLNVCCCLWVVIGGAFAARTLIKRSPTLPVTNGDGAAVGALAGLISSGVYLVIGIPLSLLTSESWIPILESLSEKANDPNMRARIEDIIRESQKQGTAEQIGGALIQWIIVAAVAVGFSTLGGLIGVALLEKRKGQPLPPPPAPPAGYSGYNPNS